MVTLQAAFGGRVSADQLQLFFGPNERRVGKEFLGDPSVDDAALRLSQFSMLGWLQRFPHWHLGVRLLPPPPPPPGVAIFRAAAMAEGKDPEKAVQEARMTVRRSFSHKVMCAPGCSEMCCANGWVPS
jgi:hypothetical protein